MKKILLLGSGELGKEFVIAAKRLGCHVVACDSYRNAPAMQVADEQEVFDMLDGDALDRVVLRHEPDFIVPEIEAIRTERFYDYENGETVVVPSAKAANFTMNRRAIRDLASTELGLKTASFAYAQSLDEMKEAVAEVGMPCVVKPLMSSSGKGQSTIHTASDIEKAWNFALEGSRGDVVEVIVEEFIEFDSEITLLTVTQQSGETLFCPPIGHRQERGDYQESWMPADIDTNKLQKAQEMADKVTRELGRNGIWGVEFFLTKEEVYFSELSPRPHDTGMVTLINCIALNEFELHLHAILGLPIPDLSLRFPAASAVILAGSFGAEPRYEGLEKALSMTNSSVRIFGKPNTRPYRRMGVALYSGLDSESGTEVQQKARAIADQVKVLNG